MNAIVDTRQVVAAALFGFDMSAPPVPHHVATHRPGARLNACGEILAGRYPVVRRMLGEEPFDAVAWLYQISEPPGLPVRPDFGDGFPRFLKTFGPGASIDYVSDIAELEMVRGRAARAARVSPVGIEAFAPLSFRAMRTRRVVLHPSVGLVASRFPVLTIWQANQTDGEDANTVTRWGAESVLVARPGADVEMRRLAPGALALLAALSADATIGGAFEAALAASPGFDPAVHLLALIERGIVAGTHQVGSSGRGRLNDNGTGGANRSGSSCSRLDGTAG